MKSISVLKHGDEPITIDCFGYESISADAHWGRGARDGFILHYVLSGEGFFNGRRVGSGEGFIIRPREMHEYHSSRECPWTYFWVMFAGEGAEGACNSYIDSDEDGIFRFSGTERILNLKELILSSGSSMNSTEALGYFYLLMACSCRPESCGSSNRYVSEAKRYMELNLHRSFRITEVARSIGISDRYLYNLFIMHEGVPPKAYLSSLRIKRARTLLGTTSCSVKEAAASVGFADSLAFSKFFSEREGVSPTEYRRRAK